LIPTNAQPCELAISHFSKNQIITTKDNDEKSLFYQNAHLTYFYKTNGYKH